MRSSPPDLLVPSERAAKLRTESRGWPSVDLTPRQICDLELLLNGAFAPLTGFMGRADRDSVVQHIRLTNRTLWPLPITLDVTASFRASIHTADRVALRDAEGVMLAALSIDEVWSDDTKDQTTQQWHVAGNLEGLQLPVHYDFTHLRLTPSAAWDDFARRGWSTVAALHTPLASAAAADVQRGLAAARDLRAALLVHLITGPVRRDDVAHYDRVRAYDAAVRDQSAAMLALLPLAMDQIRARALLLRALVARNFGCTHLLVHGSVPHEVAAHEEDLGIAIVPMPETAGEVATEHATGTPQPDRASQGFTVFFTGLSGSGKSTIANALLVKLLELGGRRVTLLDGDAVRKHLSSELGFSKEHRDLNVRRIGYVASEITKHGGVAICAPIAPYDEVRKDVRRMIEPHGGFILVHVATPLEICEQRDRKGLYAKARAGLLPQFTGISDPYEVPTDAAVVIDTDRMQIDDAATTIVDYLRGEGYLVS